MRTRVYRPRWEDSALVLAMAKLAFQNQTDLGLEEEAVLQALMRIKPDLRGASLDEVSRYLQSLNDAQLSGLASNIKGVLHELHFVALENEDGDDVIATLFDDPSHESTDVLLTNTATGEAWELQLKATDSASYVRSWIDAHEDGTILVTEELASSMGIETSGLSNASLTADVQDFIQLALADESLWDQVPMLSVVSTSIIIAQLFQRLKRGELEPGTFYTLAAKATGLRMMRLTLIAALLSTPGVNVAAGAVLVATALESLRQHGAHKAQQNSTMGS